MANSLAGTSGVYTRRDVSPIQLRRYGGAETRPCAGYELTLATLKALPFTGTS